MSNNSVSARLMKVTHFKDREFASGDGSHLIDVDGIRYLDFFADVGTASLGYASREQKRIMAQMIVDNVPVHAPNLFGFESRNRAASRLASMTEMDSVFFCNSGAEAVEAAIKLARLHEYKNRLDGDVGRREIVTYKDGFHGRTLATLAAGGPAPTYHREGFGPLPGSFSHFTEISEINPNALAVMLAPVFGNNDVRLYQTSWLNELRRYCTNNGIILIFDEVQTGSGRTGRMTYAQKVGVKPDIQTLAKGIAMGAPVGVLLARKPYADAFTPGTHWSTFGGNPISMAFVNGMLDWLERSSNIERVRAVGDQILDFLGTLGWPKNIRAAGMLIAFDVDVDTLKFAEECLERKLIVGAFRSGPGAVKITPPLNISDEDLAQGLKVIHEAYLAVKNKAE